MTRREFEDKLLDALEAFERTWKELNPAGRHISAFIIEGNIRVMDFDAPGSPTATRYADGTRMYSEDE